MISAKYFSVKIHHLFMILKSKIGQNVGNCFQMCRAVIPEIREIL